MLHLLSYPTSNVWLVTIYKTQRFKEEDEDETGKEYHMLEVKSLISFVQWLTLHDNDLFIELGSVLEIPLHLLNQPFAGLQRVWS